MPEKRLQRTREAYRPMSRKVNVLETPDTILRDLQRGLVTCPNCGKGTSCAKHAHPSVKP